MKTQRDCIGIMHRDRSLSRCGQGASGNGIKTPLGVLSCPDATGGVVPLPKSQPDKSDAPAIASEPGPFDRFIGMTAEELAALPDEEPEAMPPCRASTIWTTSTAAYNHRPSHQHPAIPRRKPDASGRWQPVRSQPNESRSF
jgi:hypothetical protein